MPIRSTEMSPARRVGQGGDQLPSHDEIRVFVRHGTAPSGKFRSIFRYISIEIMDSALVFANEIFLFPSKAVSLKIF